MRISTRRIALITGLIAVIALGAVSMLVEGVAAKQPVKYDASFLLGTYYFNFVQIRVEDDGVWHYCEETGAVSFDGNGEGIVAQHPKRCIADGGESKNNAEGPSAVTYVVSPDGEVTIYDVSGGEARHGRLLHKGELLLLDGTNLPIPGVDDPPPGTSLIQHGVAARQ